MTEKRPFVLNNIVYHLLSDIVTLRIKTVTSVSNDSTNVTIRIRNKGNNKITELRTILQRESQNS